MGRLALSVASEAVVERLVRFHGARGKGVTREGIGVRRRGCERFIP